ncbi:CVNH domain-containing protein [Zavarzinia compransoris]|nr:CVNH domain-containing protein [Zavarzinia compransoris]TDP46201.1 CVNH domain-containing protein [Zavarzinia compransoris]
MRFALCTLAALLLGGGAASAAPSSFQRSCSDIQIEVSGSDAYLVAQCKDRQGRYRNTELLLLGYQNIDGTLKRQGYEGASFQRSCDQYWLDVSHEKVFLNGSCKRRNGSYRQSRIELQGIHNDNGQLISDGY